MEIKEILQLAEQYEHQLPVLASNGFSMEDKPLAGWLDQTLLKPEATPAQLESFCQAAREHPFASVCINGVYLPLARRILEGSPVALCVVVGFPLGAMSTRAKALETRCCLEDGAQEIDMVVSVGRLKGGDYAGVLEDIEQVTETAHAGGALVKVILEMALLERREKMIGCLLAQAAGAEFVKTSTGFAATGATLEDVDLMRRVVGPATRTGVKAAGGIRCLADARAMLRAGANRLGTSAGVKILQEALNEAQ